MNFSNSFSLNLFCPLPYPFTWWNPFAVIIFDQEKMKSLSLDLTLSHGMSQWGGGGGAKKKKKK